MNNLAYGNQKSENVAPKVEEILRKDLGVNEALPFTIDEQGAPNDGALGAILKDSRAFLFGGKETVLFTINFNIQQPKPVKIHFSVNRQGIGCHVGSIVFNTFINKAVKGPVTMEGPKTFGTSKFIGDPETSGKLNNNKELLKLADKFARTKSDIAGGIKMERYFKVEPFNDGALLMIITLARSTSMGMSATTDAKDFFSIASLVEASL
jgi:hypothetical protein